MTILLLLAVLIGAVGAGVTVVRFGDSGARAVWTDNFTEEP